MRHSNAKCASCCAEGFLIEKKLQQKKRNKKGLVDRQNYEKTLSNARFVQNNRVL